MNKIKLLIALILVDLQNDFFSGGALGVPDGDKIIENVNKLIALAVKNGWVIVMSRDWHEKITKHFKEYGGDWIEHCVKNTHGAEFHPQLNIKDLKNIIIVSKGMDPEDLAGYSAFEPKAQCADGRPLKVVLNELGVTNTVVCGLATDYCVRATALDAVKNGFNVSVVMDACEGVEFDSSLQAKFEMMSSKVGILNTSDLTRHLS
ncbi:MAG: isochorismatase family protein [Candidatus Nomurabacteria bacterium]|nr:isochorismatase family protein [Candidatus Nomurabacteria bacterium]